MRTISADSMAISVPAPMARPTSACTSAGATLAAAVQLLGMGKAKRPLCVFAGRHIYG